MKTGINNQNKELFDSFKLGNTNMKNRFVVPSINRFRANKSNNMPVDLMGYFYMQRYHNALIITDDCYVSGDYFPFKGLAGIYNEQQTKVWLEIVDKVHSRTTNIYLSLFHPGRVVSDSQLPQGVSALAPSQMQVEGKNIFSKDELFSVPSEMTKEDINRIKQDFKKAAFNAKQAGFDGIQINAGNGFLIDQFLRDGSNKRKDEYGGSIQNRCRLCLEIIDEILTVYSNDRLSIKLSPINQQYDMSDSNPIELMAYLLKEIEKRKIAFVEIRKLGYLDIIPTQQKQIEFSKQNLEDPMPEFFKIIRTLYKGNLIANSDFQSFEEANSLVRDIGYQAVAFEVLSITNPDIPQRIRERGNINKDLRSIFLYKGDRNGYTDYPYYIAHSKF
ncbi:hypothetical protein ABPG72_020790 [Tetrahymena utriculariae]